MNERGYRIALVASLALCVLLAGGLAYLVLQRHRPAPVTDDADPFVVL
jgi:hypothetical protein